MFHSSKIMAEHKKSLYTSIQITKHASLIKDILTLITLSCNYNTTFLHLIDDLNDKPYYLPSASCLASFVRWKIEI